MRKYIVAALLLFISFAASAQMSEDEVFSAIKRMQDRYPRITLCDIYKSFYQDRFGPGHIIESKEKAQNYLLKELERTNAYSVRQEPTGAKGNFIRVDMFYIKDSVVNIDLYLDCLMRSVVDGDDGMIEQWLKDWELMQKVIESNNIKIENYEADREFIRERIAKGIYEMNHSRLFNDLYHPHYRIIRRDIWEKELNPIIK